MGPDPVIPALSAEAACGRCGTQTHAAVKLKETEARVRLEQALKQKMEELKLCQVRLKKAQGEIFKAQNALVEVEKMRPNVLLPKPGASRGS